ncbi:hypothetical protein [Agrobacterium tumefaciens]|uniref:hypothetical protein n=1 Tax=Agrobacterium tumefaciens TaxID=358 RepID=UPI003BA276E8
MVNANALVADENGACVSVAEQVAALRVLRQCLENGIAVPSEISSKVLPGLDGYFAAIDQGEAASLDQSLGLKRHGGVTARKAAAKAERDLLLQNLARSRWLRQSPAVAGRQMHAEFLRYEKTRWIRDRRNTSPPAPEPDCTFWQLLRRQSRVPGPDHLRKILAVVFQDPI